MFDTDVCRRRVAEEHETGHTGDRTRRAKQGEMGFTERAVGETDQKKKEVIQGVADKESGKRLRAAEGERLFPLLTGRSSYSGGGGVGRIPERDARRTLGGRKPARRLQPCASPGRDSDQLELPGERRHGSLLDVCLSRS